MEKNKTSKSISAELNYRNKTHNKILYKFQIKNNNSNHHNYIGKCYLVNINFLSGKNTSFPKNKTKPEKLPIINIKENKPNLNTITSSKNCKTLNNYKLKLSEKNESKTIPFNLKLIHNQTKGYQKNNNYKSTTSLTESSVNLKKDNHNKYNDIIERINQKYFMKKATINYLTNLFFGNNEIHDLKVVNLSKIKDKKQNEINYNLKSNIKYNSISKYNSYFRRKPLNKKLNSFNEKNYENINDIYKLSKLNVSERLKNFKNLKIKQSKELVDNALKDLIKAKEKNLIYIENFRKSYDFKFEDF